jgi:hypothetical protein
MKVIGSVDEEEDGDDFEEKSILDKVRLSSLSCSSELLLTSHLRSIVMPRAEAKRRRRSVTPSPRMSERTPGCRITSVLPIIFFALR